MPSSPPRARIRECFSHLEHGVQRVRGHAGALLSVSPAQLLLFLTPDVPSSWAVQNIYTPAAVPRRASPPSSNPFSRFVLCQRGPWHIPPEVPWARSSLGTVATANGQTNHTTFPIEVSRRSRRHGYGLTPTTNSHGFHKSSNPFAYRSIEHAVLRNGIERAKMQTDSSAEMLRNDLQGVARGRVSLICT